MFSPNYNYKIKICNYNLYGKYVLIRKIIIMFSPNYNYKIKICNYNLYERYVVFRKMIETNRETTIVFFPGRWP